MVAVCGDFEIFSGEQYSSVACRTRGTGCAHGIDVVPPRHVNERAPATGLRHRLTGSVGWNSMPLAVAQSSAFISPCSITAFTDASFMAVTWSVMSEMSGDTTTVMPPSATAGTWKHTLLPAVYVEEGIIGGKRPCAGGETQRCLQQAAPTCTRHTTHLHP